MTKIPPPAQTPSLTVRWASPPYGFATQPFRSIHHRWYGAPMKKLLFFYDIVCPYAYLASLKVEDLAKRTRAELVYKPILLGGVFNKIGRDQAATAGLP